MKKLFAGATIIFMLIFAACTTAEIAPEDLSPWIGLYSYENSGYLYYIHVHDYYEEIGASIEVRDLEMDEPVYDLSTEIRGDLEEIRFYLKGSAPKRHLSDATYGDLLLTLSIRDGQLHTQWGILTPINQLVADEGIYFIRD